MSKATELAKGCGFDVSLDWRGLGSVGVEGVDCTEELEAFYHAARAEALREAADNVSVEFEAQPSATRYYIRNRLRAMADREGK